MWHWPAQSKFCQAVLTQNLFGLLITVISTTCQWNHFFAFAELELNSIRARECRIEAISNDPTSRREKESAQRPLKAIHAKQWK